MSEKVRRKYDKVFKMEAIQLMNSSGKSAFAMESELGIGHGRLRAWKIELENDPDNSFPGNGNLKPHDKEIARLKRELDIAKQERDILKKAISIFSKTPG
jgi:transposase